MDTPVPVILLNARNAETLAYLEPQSCHGDIIEPLSLILQDYPEVDWFCPEPATFRYCFWYRGRTIFACAAGMHDVSFRLPRVKRGLAESLGEFVAERDGEAWFAFKYDHDRLGEFARIAYDFAPGASTVLA